MAAQMSGIASALAFMRASLASFASLATCNQARIAALEARMSDVEARPAPAAATVGHSTQSLQPLALRSPRSPPMLMAPPAKFMKQA